MNVLMIKLACILGTVIVCCQGISSGPVVGVVTQPRESNWPSSLGTDYIAASYIKYVEAAGCQAALIKYDGSAQYMEQMYAQVDAVLFPGGGQQLDNEPKLVAAAKFFVDKSLRSGGAFPVFGHCQGFELITMVATGLPRSLCMTTAVRAENISLPLHFSQVADQPGMWFSHMPAPVKNTLQNKHATINMHSWSITPEIWKQHKGLADYRILSTSVVPSVGKPFVSTFQHSTAPIYAMQFHAEKVIYEWTPTENICHSYDCVQAMTFFIDFMARRVRQGQSERQRRALDANASMCSYHPICSRAFSSFDQVYFWK